MQQVITISADGSLSGLQRKKGQGVDLRSFGKAEIRRVSEIQWDEQEQRWAISAHLDGSAWVTLTRGIYGAYGVLLPTVQFRETDGALLFPDYDDAVSEEIRFLDFLRKNGKH